METQGGSAPAAGLQWRPVRKERKGNGAGAGPANRQLPRPPASPATACDPVPTVRLSRVAALCLAASLGCAGIGGEPAEELGHRMTYQEFRAQAFVEPESGTFIVDGDTPLADEKHLREFYDRFVAADRLIIDTVGGVDNRWSAKQKKALTFCVSKAFGSRYPEVLEAMTAAAGAWESAADLRFVHLEAEDGRCDEENEAVLFDVNPVDVGGQYIARSFFPNTRRAQRNVLIDRSAWDSSQPDLAGVLRHELGHTLGFRHEHTRPEAGACFEDDNWRPLTDYDAKSVMHYPQCHGTAGWALALTEKDRQGARSVYGAPGGGAVPSAPPEPAPADGAPVTDVFEGEVGYGQKWERGPFAVAPGSEVEVLMSGEGEPDLYVRFGAAPTTARFDCRPFLDGATESCRLTVPTGQSRLYLMVHGYDDAQFEISVTYTPPSSQPPTRLNLKVEESSVRPGASIHLTLEMSFAFPSALTGQILLDGQPAGTVAIAAGKKSVAFEVLAGSREETLEIELRVGALSAQTRVAVEASSSGLLLNEIDVDQPGIDNAEFIELVNAGSAAVDPKALAVVLVDPSGAEIDRFALSSAGALAAGKRLVLAPKKLAVASGASVIRFTGAQTNRIPNYAPLGVALIDTKTKRVLDALSVGGRISAARIVGFAGAVDLVRGTPVKDMDSAKTAGTLARRQDGQDSGSADADWHFTGTPTPGKSNR